MLSMQRHSESAAREDVLRKTWLWHGTNATDPRVLCMGQDGVDFRRVRLRLCACMPARVTSHDAACAYHLLTSECGVVCGGLW